MDLFHDFEELSPTITGWHIHVKVLRAIKFVLTPENKILRLVLENENGQRIEAVVGQRLFDHYANKILEGTWITIMIFRVAPNLELIKAASHQFKIYFTPETIVKKSQVEFSHQFNQLTSIPDILDERINVSVLVDVCGAIVDVGELKNTSPNNDMSGFMLTFNLADKEKNLLNCVAIGKEAVDLNFNYRMLSSSVLIVVLRFWRVERTFSGRKNVQLFSNGIVSQIFPNPDIVEAIEIREMIEGGA